MIHELHELLSRAGARVRSLRLWSSLAVCWVFWAAIAYAVARFAAPQRGDWSAVWAVLAGGVLLSAAACWRLAMRAGRDPRLMARRIEAAHPELGALLLAAVETAPAPKFKRLGYLQASVVKNAVSHGRRHNWADATSIGRVRLAKCAHVAALAALVSSCVMLFDRAGGGARASSAPDADRGGLLGADYNVTVQPGDAEIERGATLLVIAQFRGATPPDADLVVEPVRHGAEQESGVRSPDPAESSVRSMTRSLDDPQFVGRVPNVADDLAYYVAFAGQRTPAYRITVFDYPALVRADARLEYPAYTGLEAKVVEDVRQITAVEGTQLVLTFRLNKDVASARLVDRAGEETMLERAAGAPHVYQWTTTLRASQRLKLHLVDRQQRRNKLPPEFVINVTVNKPPTIKLERPARDVRVSPVEELSIEGELADDFGLTAYGLAYALGGDEPADVTIPPAVAEPAVGEPAAGEPASAGGGAAVDAASAGGGPSPPKQLDLVQLIDFESLAAEPDQLVSYYVWAEDVGPDGQPRRTYSDMYFAEVRPFDEIFREGQQPTEQQQREQQQQQQEGQPQGAGQQAEQLAELQKQIVNATWSLVRRETGQEPAFDFAADASAVADAQQQALDQLAELAGQLEDAESQQFVDQARQQMESALEQLTRAADAADPAPLRPALSAERAAYQALLKLRARQFDVTQSQSGQQGQSGTTSGAGSASQRQLNELELSADQNRYETQSRARAAAEQNAQQLNESRQVLDRLRELARRQQDLNQRLRELQSALDAAETAEDRAEIERQLKRLRDQQREILRDAESLDNDLQNSENAQQLADAAQQLDQTRERVQNASEALDRGQVSQALAEGARAERELTELRDEFRRRTADRFTEEMQSLREAARELDQRQQELSEQLAEMNSAGLRSLRETGPREELAAGLQQQQSDLTETLERMRQTVAEAEEPEPLLAGALFDAVQETMRQRTEESLDTARQLVEAGVSSEAGDAMRAADRGVEELRERVERAAESVLGDETEALRRASDQLRELAEELNAEIDNATGRQPTAGETQPEGEPGEGQPQPDGEPASAGGQPGEDQQPSDGRQPGEAQQAGEGEQQGSTRGGPQGAQPGAPTNPGEPASAGGRPGERQPPANAQPPNEGDQPGGGQPSGAPGDPDPGGQPDGAERNGANRTGGERNPAGGGGPGGFDRLGDLNRLFAGEEVAPRGPITGENFRDWADRLGQVEDMLDNPELAAEAARIRDRAELARAAFRRHATEPDWDRLVEIVAQPLVELRGQIDAEIRRRESPDALVPIDRDAAPAEFADEVRLYYQRLGSGE